MSLTAAWSEAPWWLWCLLALAGLLHMVVDYLRFRHRRDAPWLD
jgi:hypothetical protein